MLPSFLTVNGAHVFLLHCLSRGQSNVCCGSTEAEVGRGVWGRGCLSVGVVWLWLFRDNHTFTMSLCRLLLPLLLLVSDSLASHFYGTVMTYYPKNSSQGKTTVRSVFTLPHSFQPLESDINNCRNYDFFEAIVAHNDCTGTLTCSVDVRSVY